MFDCHSFTVNHSALADIKNMSHGNHISVWSPGCRPGVKHVEEV